MGNTASLAHCFRLVGNTRELKKISTTQSYFINSKSRWGYSLKDSIKPVATCIVPNVVRINSHYHDDYE